MELRHLRYFMAVGEALSFTKASVRLSVAQPALSRQVQNLEDEIGVDLLKRSRRGVILTAEGKLFLEEVRQILRHTVEAVEKVRALARGEYGELHVGYSPTPTTEMLPKALAAFQKAVPGVKVSLHDMSSEKTVDGLHSGALELAVLPVGRALQKEGIEFEVLRTYPLFVALSLGHPLSRLKTIPLEKLAAEPFIALRRKDYPGYHHLLEQVFAPLAVKPRVVLECDTASSLLTAIESGSGIALATSVFKQVTGKRLVYRPLTGTNEVLSVGIARAKNADLTPAGEKFCEILRKVMKETAFAK